jgi:DNA polymerase III alpha subunit (gram-positive type)
MNQNLTWVAFNSSFDFAYMVKLLDSNDEYMLPPCKYDFLKMCDKYFPNFYDVKHLEISTGSLAQQAINYDIQWEGNSHQAGSDSLVTMKLFCSKERDFLSKSSVHHKKYNKNLDKNVIYKFDHYPNSDDDTFLDHKFRNRP